MSSGRSVPLFDPHAEPATWNERMTAGEYAVHQSSSKNTSPSCTVFPSLGEAENYAQQQVEAHPEIRCRVYDHQGFVGAPVREFKGTHFKGEHDISPRVRRWLGAGFLIVGTVMVLVDWRSDFKLTWPAVVGSRLLIPGLLLYAVEALVLLQAKYGKKWDARTRHL